MTLKIKRASLAAYPLIFLGFALRLYRIGGQSVWWDEAYSLHVAQQGIAAVLDLPGSIAWNHPPLHYALLTIWTRLVGQSEPSLRYLSLLCGVLLLAVVYRVTRRLFEPPAALAALAVTALSPLYVVYSQEARVYALLPLLYLLLLDGLHRLTDGQNPPAPRRWLALALVEALLLYAHFIAALALLYANLYLLVGWLRRRFALRDWLGSQALAAVLFAPWLWNMARHWRYVQSQIGIREWQAASPAAWTFVWRIWRFWIGGNLAAAEGHATLVFAAALLGLSGLLAWLLARRIDDPRRRTAAMLAHGLLPLAFCFALWQVWPQAQPRYTLLFAIPLFIALGRLLACLLAGRSVYRLAGAWLIASLALAFGVGLYVQYFDQRFYKDDVRGVATYLSQAATAQDVVLIGPDDYSLPYYYRGPATVVMARDEPRADKVQRLSEATTGKQRLFLVHWQPSKADLHALRPFLLERAGQLAAWRDFRGLDVRLYELDGPTGPLPGLTAAPQARFGPLQLTGVFYEPTAANDDAIAVALRWQLVKPAAAPYKVVVMLGDAQGQRLSSADVLLLDEAGRPTHLWPVNAGTVNFYVVPVPVGTPPLSYRLTVGVYDANSLARLPLHDADGPTGGQDLSLGQVSLRRGGHFDRDPYRTWSGLPWQTPAETEVAPGLQLAQFAVWPRAALPGERVNVLLRWRASGAPRAASAPLLRLAQAGQTWLEVGSPLLAEAYPPDRWAAGEVVVERRSLSYPPRRGPADLTLTADDRHLMLGAVQLNELALRWQAPAMQTSLGVQIGDFATLLGYDLERAALTAGQPFRLILYWQAQNDAPLETPYTVFTQLLTADGRLIAQHDGPPADGTRLTTTWVGGEVIADAHTLTFSDPAYSGPARLIVGLYDSATVTRVPTAQGQDHVALPEVVTVTSRCPSP